MPTVNSLWHFGLLLLLRNVTNEFSVAGRLRSQNLLVVSPVACKRINISLSLGKELHDLNFSCVETEGHFKVTASQAVT